MYQKLIQTGDFVELFTFEKTPLVLQKRNVKEHHTRLYAKRTEQVSKQSTDRKEPKRDKILKRRRLDNLHRAKKSFARIVQSNISEQSPPLFISATFARCTDLEYANCEWKAFIRRAKLYFGIDLPYIVVPEFQARGDIHFHALIFSNILLEYGDRIEDTHELPDGTIRYNYRNKTPGRERTDRTFSLLWGNGYIDCLATDGRPALSGYLSKYFAKAFLDDRMRGKKLYSTSRNIKRPLSVSGTSTVKTAIDVLEIDKCPIVFKDTFDTVWLGQCHYKKIKFK